MQCSDSKKDDGNILVMGCKNTKIPDSVTQIGEQAFAGCSDLSDITIPNGVTNIAAWAFWDCSKLKRITISPNVTNIGSWAVGWGTSEGNGNGSGVAYSDFIVCGMSGSEAEW